MIKRICLATDFSACAERAAEYALYVAKAWNAAIDVLHVLEFQPGMDPDYPVNRLYLDDLRKETDRQIAALVQRAGQLGIRVTEHHAIGIPSQQIIETARKLDVDLVVLGTHGRTGLEHVLLGSTAERVIKGAHCPVLAVRQSETTDHKTSEERASRISVEHVLVPIDFSDCSLDALEYAAQIAHQLKAHMTVLHVLEPVAYGLDFTLTHPTDPDHRERLKTRLTELTAALMGTGIEVEHTLRGGLPAEGILNSERARRTDLIVMGTHGRHGFSHLAYGSVAEAVLRRARCPVLTVRSPKFSPAHRRLVSTNAGEGATG